MNHFWKLLTASFNNYLESLLANIASLLVHLTLVILVTFLTVLIARRVRQAMIQVLARTRASINSSTLVGNICYAGVITLGVLLLLGIVGLQLSALVTVLGLISLAISLSIQDVLKNLVSGIYLLLERPFRIGDEIQVETFSGIVEDIALRTTILKSSTGEQVLIPNATVFSNVVTNTSAYHARRQSLTISLPQEKFSLEKGSSAVSIALKEAPGLLPKPAPTITLSSIGDQKLKLAVQVWTPRDNGADTILPPILLHLSQALPEAEISVEAPK